MAESDWGMPVDALIAEVKNALVLAGVTNANPAADLRVSSVQLILNVVATTTDGVKVNFRVPFIGADVGIGSTHTQHDTHTIDITLVPPSQLTSRAARSSGDFPRVLVAAIGRVRQTVVSAAGGEDPWALSTATVDISFGVTRDGSISVGVEGGMTSETTNTLRLTLAPA
ncbi:trypco2 family protein [Trebonia sp.]|uniref:trypco2 family protein n=1 Tax=Trebonia sp. TaxID=2767075 RepID=UPI00262AED21|nr:trypco2 family protein [Trebonia sp.]